MAELTSPSAYGAGNITRPVVPVDFAATGGALHIDLAWTETGSPKFVQIEFSLTDSAYAPLVTLLGGVGVYIHADRVANTTYYYRLRQVNRLKWSDWTKANAKTDA
jgi:hypothetical protein